MAEVKDILQEYVATANNPQYKSDWNTINSKFPELKGYDAKLLQEYVATANNPKYNSNFETINSKFPELFNTQQKKQTQTTTNGIGVLKKQLPFKAVTDFQQSIVDLAVPNKNTENNPIIGIGTPMEVVKPKTQTVYRSNTYKEEVPIKTSVYDVANAMSTEQLLYANNDIFKGVVSQANGDTQLDEFNQQSDKNNNIQAFNRESELYNVRVKTLKERAGNLERVLASKYQTPDFMEQVKSQMATVKQKSQQYDAYVQSRSKEVIALQTELEAIVEQGKAGTQPIEVLKPAYDAKKAQLYAIQRDDEQKRSEIEQLQNDFNGKLDDPDFALYSQIYDKINELSGEQQGLISKPEFAEYRKLLDEGDKAQAKKDAMKKAYQSKGILGKAVDIYTGIGMATNPAAYFLDNGEQVDKTFIGAKIADEGDKLLGRTVKALASVPKMLDISNPIGDANKYDVFDKMFDQAVMFSKKRDILNPIATDVQRDIIQKYADVDGYRVMLDENGKPTNDVRDASFYKVNDKTQKEITDKYNENPTAYKTEKDFSASTLTTKATPTILDMGTMMATTALTGGSSAVMVGTAAAQMYGDMYESGLNAGLTPQEANDFATLTSIMTGMVSLVNPMEANIVKGTASKSIGKFISNSISKADVQLIRSGEMSIGQYAKRMAKEGVKNTFGENLEELVLEPAVQRAIETYYNTKAQKNGQQGFEDLNKPFFDTKQTIETAMITTMASLLMTPIEVANSVPEQRKIALQNALDNPQAFIDLRNSMLNSGDVSQEKFDYEVKAFEEISKQYNTVKPNIKEDLHDDLAELLLKKYTLKNTMSQVNDEVLNKKNQLLLDDINKRLEEVADGTYNKGKEKALGNIANPNTLIDEDKIATYNGAEVTILDDLADGEVVINTNNPEIGEDGIITVEKSALTDVRNKPKDIEQLQITSAVININGKEYEGKNHAEAILKAQADGQDISQVNRQSEGLFKLSDGTIINREQAKEQFGQDRSELIIPQDEASNQANVEYKRIQDEQKNPITPTEPINAGQELNIGTGIQQVNGNGEQIQQGVGIGQNMSNQVEVPQIEQEQEEITPTTETTPNVEAKKADIERRRQEEKEELREEIKNSIVDKEDRTKRNVYKKDNKITEIKDGKVIYVGNVITTIEINAKGDVVLRQPGGFTTIGNINEEGEGKIRMKIANMKGKDAIFITKKEYITEDKINAKYDAPLKENEYYHATDNNEILAPSDKGYKKREGNNVVGEGIYFGKDKEHLTDRYGENTIKVELDIKNPLVSDNKYIVVDGREIDVQSLSKDDINFLKEKGYDAIKYVAADKAYSKFNETIVFDKSQIKKVEQSLKETTKAEKQKKVEQVSAEQKLKNDKHDRMVGLMREYNSTPTNKKTRKSEIRQSINKLASDLGYTVKGKIGDKIDVLNSKGKVIRKINITSDEVAVTPEVVEKTKELAQGWFEWNGNELDYHIDASQLGLTWQEIRRAKADLDAGKTESTNINRVANAINEYGNMESLPLVRGFGGNYERIDVTGEDLFWANKVSKQQTAKSFTPIDKTAFEKLLDKLKKAFPNVKVELFGKGNLEEAKKALEKYGVDIVDMLSVWHGSPHNFDKFSTDKMGTGEGAQAFGWGLYFTDLESIARNYAEKLSGATEYDTLFNGQVIDSTHPLYYSDLTSSKNKQEALKNANKIRTTNSLEVKNKQKAIQFIESLDSDEFNLETKQKKGNRNLYKVALHKGKQPSEYTWLEWDKPLSENNKNKIIEQGKKEGIDTSNLFGFGNNIDSKTVYDNIAFELFNDDEKEASLFLLRAGIDGIKYPAESIARGATSDNARGFNYVVFDENAIKIEEKIQFLKTKDGTIYGFKTPDGKVFINTDNLNANTPIHEYAHIWQSVFPQEFARGIELLKLSPQGQALIREIQKNPAYKGKTISEIQAEALVTAIGNKGEAIFNSNPTLWNKFKEWLNDFFKKIGDKLGFELSPDDKFDMFTKKVVGELLGGKVLSKEVGKSNDVELQSVNNPSKEIIGEAYILAQAYLEATDFEYNTEARDEFIEKVRNNPLSKAIFTETQLEKIYDGQVLSSVDKIRVKYKMLIYDIKNNNRLSKQQIQQKQQEMADDIKWLINNNLKSITGKQAEKFINLANKAVTNNSPAYLARIINQIANLADQRTYQKAKTLYEVIKARSKRKGGVQSGKLTGVLQDFATINPLDVSDIAKYVELAEKVKQASNVVKQPTDADSDLVYDEVQAYVKAQQDEINSNAINDTLEDDAMTFFTVLDNKTKAKFGDDKTFDDLNEVQQREVFESITKDDIKKYGLTDEERDMVEAFKEIKTEQKRQDFITATYVKIGELKDLLANSVGVITQSPAEKEITDALLNVKLDDMTATEMARVLKLINGITQNNDYSGGGAFVAQQKSVEVNSKMNTLKSEIGEFRKLSEGGSKFRNFQQISVAMAKGKKLGAKLMEASGINNLMRGIAKTKTYSHNLQKAFKAEKFKSSVFEPISQMRQSIYAAVIQTKIGDDVKEAEHIERWKRIIEKNIENLRTINKDGYKEQAELLQKALDEVIGDRQQLKDIADNMSKIDSEGKRVVQFFTDNHAEQKPRFRENSLLFHNKEIEEYNSYTKLSITSLTGDTVRDTGEKLMNDARSTGITKKKSKSMIDRANYESLNDNTGLDFNFINKQMKALGDNEYDINTSADITTLANAFNSDNKQLRELLGAENFDLLKKKLQTIVGTSKYEETTIVDDVINEATKISRVIALGSITQALKQATVLLSTYINSAGTDNLRGVDFKLITGTQREKDNLHKLMAQSEIGARRAESAGGFYDNTSIKKNISDGFAKKTAKYFGRGKDFASNVSMGLLRWADIKAADLSWVTFYKKYLRDNNLTFDENNEFKNPNKDAMAYAETMVQTAQGANTEAGQADLWNMAKGITQMVFPFMSFAIQGKARLVDNLMNIANGDDRVEALRDTAGYIGEQLAFNKIKLLIGIAVTQQLLPLLLEALELGDDDDDRLNKEQKENKKLVEGIRKEKQTNANFWNNIIKDLTYGTAPLIDNNLTIPLINGIVNWRKAPYDLLTKGELNKTSNLGLIPEYKSNDFNILSGGTIGVGVNQIKNLITDFNMITDRSVFGDSETESQVSIFKYKGEEYEIVHNGKYTRTDMFFNNVEGRRDAKNIEIPNDVIKAFVESPSDFKLVKEVRKRGGSNDNDLKLNLTEEQKAYAIFMAIVGVASFAGINETTLNTVNNKVRGEMKKQVIKK